MDPVRVRQVLTNLIGNAIKITEDGRITVASQVQAGPREGVALIEISVKDTGIGFDATRTEALFSPFTQADGSITRSFGGTGLGLAITRSLMQLMGGDVTATSQPGQGACFTIKFPVRLVAETTPDTVVAGALPQEVDAGTASKPLSVLLVEDHEINRKLAEIMLARTGCDCVCAQDGEEALAALAQQDFDVVLMDVMMPVMDGLSALRVLREREAGTGRRTAVLMVTAHAMTGDRERFLAAGADGYVSKPMSQVVLEREIRRAPDGVEFPVIEPRVNFYIDTGRATPLPPPLSAAGRTAPQRKSAVDKTRLPH
jgi:CheY-like chemotaxis protein/anti-sigma regulatory factor (Ser/Thr protein kinase)